MASPSAGATALKYGDVNTETPSLREVKGLIENEIECLLFSIPETLDILELLQKYHSADNHLGIKSLRNYISKRGYYFDGSTFLLDYIIKNCDICMGKTTRNKLKRETCKQIITYYPRQRNVMDISELPLDINKDKSYLFSIIDHFSKYGMVFIINNKD